MDKDMLERIAKLLKVPAEAIRNFSDEMAINIIANTFQDHAVNMNYQCTFNPLEKYIEAMEENKRLYERLLQVEREKIALLERMMDRK
ncbi:MAG: hypothetical protein WDO19_22695 [Bacteroidota bacterium]